MTRIATLTADPFGTFHVEANGVLVLFSVPRAVAEKWAVRNGYILR